MPAVSMRRRASAAAAGPRSTVNSTHGAVDVRGLGGDVADQFFTTFRVRGVEEREDEHRVAQTRLELLAGSFGDDLSVIEHDQFLARRSASSRYWVVSRTVVPSSTNSSMIAQRSWRLWGSSPVVGSSRKSSGGLATRAAARSRRRRMPPEERLASQSNLEYQQLIMKQAIARNLEDPVLTNAPVVPTDRVGLDRLPEEDMAQDALVQQAYVNNPQIEQAVLSMKNNEITIKAEKNGLLPTVDAYAFYGGSAVSGSQIRVFGLHRAGRLCGGACPYPTVGYGTAVGNLFNSSAPDKGVGVNITIPLRNRVAQADQARSQMEYRQAQMRLQQLYTQIRIQVINGQYALTNDRAQVTAAQASRDYAAHRWTRNRRS